MTNRAGKQVYIFVAVAGVIVGLLWKFQTTSVGSTLLGAVAIFILGVLILEKKTPVQEMETSEAMVILRWVDSDEPPVYSVPMSHKEALILLAYYRDPRVYRNADRPLPEVFTEGTWEFEAAMMQRNAVAD